MAKESQSPLAELPPRQSAAATAFPRVAQYLALLPHGLRSYPECRVRTATFNFLLGDDRDAVCGAAMGDEHIREIFRSPATLWVPETHFLAGLLAVGDFLALTPEQHRDKVREDSRKLYRSVMYRALMSFVSPEMLMAVGSRRWSSFHQGSQVSVGSIGPKHAQVQLTFPSHLFTEPIAQLFGGIFAAALDCSRSQSVEVEILEVLPTEARFALRWT